MPTPPAIGPKLKYRGRKILVNRECLSFFHNCRSNGQTYREAAAVALFACKFTDDFGAAQAAAADAWCRLRKPQGD